MPSIPVNLRPRYYLRRRAMRHGLLGSSPFWRAVAFMVIASNTIKKVFGKQPDRLGRRRINAGHVITVAVIAPMTRKERKRSGVTKASLTAKARADLAAAQRAS